MTTDGVFKALGDARRRRILELLADRERTAGEIAEHFPIAFPSVSRHLKILRDAGLVASRRDGRHVHYRLDTTVVQDLARYLVERLGEGDDA